MVAVGAHTKYHIPSNMKSNFCKPCTAVIVHTIIIIAVVVVVVVVWRNIVNLVVEHQINGML